ncbi:hypothetical protein KAU19_06930, partial [Candidatus Parcubacteria bacterium]|nr:hypothetical protein [Candidatus Parcubacteria bacterium]
MKYDVITIGGATEDITFYTKKGILIDNKKDILRQKLLAFEYGAKIQIDKAYSTFGGGAANTAVCLSHLGFNVASLVAIGDDGRGELIERNLKKHGVDISLAQKIKDIESGFSFLLVGQSNEHIVFSNRAANTKLRITEEDLENLKYTNWIYITSLSGNWREVLESVFSVQGIKVAWNPGHIQLHLGVRVIGKYFKKTKVLIINKDEAIELVMSDEQYKNTRLRQGYGGQESRKFLNNIKNLLTIIKSWGPEIVVITNGKYGADAYDGNKFYHQDILQEKKREDTTGVGDAFGSTFIAGLELYNGNIKKAMQLSVKNTASVIGKQGAQNGLLTK